MERFMAADARTNIIIPRAQPLGGIPEITPLTMQ
jgi:hypothetical protein